MGATHKVYKCIIGAVENGYLMEPFSKEAFKDACPSFKEGTYNSFLYKHRVGNHTGSSELFELLPPGRFKLVRPYKYGF